MPDHSDSFVLIKTDPRDTSAVARFLAGLGSVHSIQEIKGPYNLIVRCRERGMRRHLDLLASVPGVRRAEACPVVGAA